MGGIHTHKSVTRVQQGKKNTSLLAPPPSHSDPSMAPKWKLHKEGARQYEGKLNPARGIADKRPFEVESASELRAAAAIPHGILRALAEPLALSPFSLDALCASLTAQERTNLLDEAMVSLLFVLFFEARHLNGRRDPNPRNPAGSPPGRGTSEPSHRILSLLDHVTWPKCVLPLAGAGTLLDACGRLL